jgi:hypothetical protein
MMALTLYAYLVIEAILTQRSTLKINAKLATKKLRNTKKTLRTTTP